MIGKAYDASKPRPGLGTHEEHIYRDFFEQAHEGFFLLSPRARFTMANRALLRLLDFPDLAELRGSVRNAIRQLLQDRDDARQLLERLGRLGRVENFQTIILRRDKTGFWGCLSIRVVRDQSGGILCYAGQLLDISETKENERLRSKSPICQTNGMAKAQFLARMNHEIRTPLQTILGLIHLAQSAKSLDRRQRHLSAMDNAGRHLSLVIENILDYAMIESGGMRLAQGDFQLDRLLSQAVEGFAEAAKTKGLDLSLSLAPDLPDLALGDGRRLRQIVDSLLQNAVRFTPAGQVDVKAWVAPCPKDQPGTVRLDIMVSDTGMGIALERHSAVFEPFFQPDQSVSRPHGAVGMGLAIARQLARAMGGDIYLESAPGMGSAFTVEVLLRLPADLGARIPPEGEKPKSSQQSSRPMRLLVVDDNLTNAFYLAEVLRPRGHEVITAASGAEALEIISRIGVDAVLMDVQMPEMDGLETTRRIRAGQAGPSMSGLPILAVSALGLDAVRDKCLTAGMRAFLTKPVDVRRLFATLDELAGEIDRRCILPRVGQDAWPADQERPGRAGESAPLPRQEYLKRLQELFEKSVSQAVAKLGEGLEKNDPEEVARQAHSITNSAVVVGADDLAVLSRKIETEALAGNLEKIRPEYQRILAFNPTKFNVAGQPPTTFTGA
jgi:PAS domain S-box-containing protein